MTFILFCLMLMSAVTASNLLITSPPTLSASPAPSKGPSATPASSTASVTSVIAPRQCEECEGTTYISPSYPSIVTHYIETVIDVPCTTSVFITDGTTMSTTLYSSDTTTTTLIEEQTVYVIESPPSLVVESSVNYITNCYTVAVTEEWTTTTGSSYSWTSTGGEETISGSWGESPAPSPTPGSANVNDDGASGRQPAGVPDNSNNDNDLGASGHQLASDPGNNRRGAAGVGDIDVRIINGTTATTTASDGAAAIVAAVYSPVGVSEHINNAASHRSITGLVIPAVGGVVAGLAVVVAAEYAFD